MPILFFLGDDFWNRILSQVIFLPLYGHSHMILQHNKACKIRKKEGLPRGLTCDNPATFRAHGPACDKVAS
jgi:hypothetical protein